MGPDILLVATARMAVRSSSRLQSLSKKPLAPRAIARATLAGLSKAENSSTGSFGLSSLMRPRTASRRRRACRRPTARDRPPFPGRTWWPSGRCGFRHDLDFRAGQEGLQAAANHFMIVGDKKLDFAFGGHRKCLCSGKMSKEPGREQPLLCAVGIGIASLPGSCTGELQSPQPSAVVPPLGGP